MYDGEVSAPLTIDLLTTAQFCDDTLEMSVHDYITNQDPQHSVHVRQKRVAVLLAAGIVAASGVGIVASIWNRISINDLENEIEIMRARNAELAKIVMKHEERSDDYIGYIGVKLNDTMRNFDKKLCYTNQLITMELIKIRMGMKVTALLDAIRVGEVNPDLIPPERIKKLVTQILLMPDSKRFSSSYLQL